VTNVSELAIRAENLSKRYRIGMLYRHDTLRDTLASSVSRARERLRRPHKTPTSPDPTPDASAFIWALNEVSFEVDQGEVLGIVGPNGAGKTTLLKILSRVTEPTAGRAEVHGRIGSLLEVGTGFHQELTGRENVYLSGAILGMKRREIDRKFDEIVAFAEFEKFLDTPVKRYSSGMQVRLGFAVAAHLDTEILLVDEVLAVGDTAFQKKSLGKMRKITREGRTVLVVSHNLVSIQEICTRAIMLSKGKLVCDGDPRYVVDQYLKSVPTSSAAGTVLARAADDRAALLSVDLTDERDQVIDRVVSGQTFAIRCTVETHDVSGSVAIDIGFDDSTGRRVANVTNVLTNEDLRIDSPLTVFSCRIPEVPLAPGEYNMIITLRGPQNLWLVCPSGATLRVESGDFFGSGKMVESPWIGTSLIRHSWKAEPASKKTP
jgi:lipopolysaccharide transport system ATP-binding protein